MFAFIRDIENLNVLEEIGERWVSEVQNLGVIRASYHMSPAFYSQVHPETRIFYYGFSEELIKLYDDPAFRKHDPIPDAVMQSGRPRTWRRILADTELNEKQRQFVKLAGELGMLDGFSVPLFGPNGRESYSTFDIGRRIEASDEQLLQTLMGIGQIAHVRICTIVRDRFMRQVDLSPRELEVLRWAASAKSVADIATIVGLSNATVDTYMRRVYAKLGAHNKIEAVTIALRHGLLRLGQ
ncbi:LuxR family transcriptional regulator [Erythrobacter sp. JK5]|uniref:helix-turn-helix transcriptional regulator n=1 Tax=Erythrobacter sp. JK5 TaxID=2829500 RepID=UPI001BA94B30|nr:LuxR family transcriptional regulator [Erythrobacter sp. JK5]QUL37553.1 autoinducer binding domain-containing protein [Erythrobacter sp. JK5]